MIRDRGDQDALGLIDSLPADQPADVRKAALAAIAKIQSNLAIWNAVQNAWYGLSLGSVLLLAAIGLAITFGVMGVINMAHGEMVMLGAYTTFVVQEFIRARNPALFDYSLAIAIPLAFLVSGASASSSSAPSSVSSTAGRWKRCSPPGACRWSCSRRCAPSSGRPTRKSAIRPG